MERKQGNRLKRRFAVIAVVATACVTVLGTLPAGASPAIDGTATTPHTSDYTFIIVAIIVAAAVIALVVAIVARRRAASRDEAAARRGSHAKK